MRVNKKYMRLTIIQTLLGLYSMKDFAKEVTSVIDEIELQDTKSTGFICRKKKDRDITEDQIVSGIAKTIGHMLDEKLDETLDYIAENYEFAYESSMVDDALVRDIFEISRSGRLIYIEMDL